MIVVAIIGVLAAVAIPAFMKYIAKAKTSEARNFVKKIYDGARAYYFDRNYTGGMRMAITPRQFPSQAPSPQPPDPTVCCEKCAPDAALWSDESWIVLHFAVSDPAYFSYSYLVASGSERTGPYTARANGDLDCDGVLSTFEMYGTVNSVYSDGPVGSAGLYRNQELE